MSCSSSPQGLSHPAASLPRLPVERKHGEPKAQPWQEHVWAPGRGPQAGQLQREALGGAVEAAKGAQRAQQLLHGDVACGRRQLRSGRQEASWVRARRAKGAGRAHACGDGPCSGGQELQAPALCSPSSHSWSTLHSAYSRAPATTSASPSTARRRPPSLPSVATSTMMPSTHTPVWKGAVGGVQGQGTQLRQGGMSVCVCWRARAAVRHVRQRANSCRRSPAPA